MAKSWRQKNELKSGQNLFVIAKMEQRQSIKTLSVCNFYKKTTTERFAMEKANVVDMVVCRIQNGFWTAHFKIIAPRMKY